MNVKATGVVVAGTAALVLALTPLAAAAKAPLAAERATAAQFTDASGDSGAAADIELVEAGNDVVTGHVVLWVKLANRSALDPDDQLFVFLNTDRDPTTGGTAGFDYAIYVDGAGGKGLVRWNGPEIEDAPAPSLATGFSRSWLSIRVQPADIGGTRAFDFAVIAARGDETDFAPEMGRGTWSYSLVEGPPQLTVDRLAVAPAPARAAKALTATMRVWREDISYPLTSGRVTCTLKVRGRAIRPVAQGFGPDGPTCRFAVPRDARGSAYTLTMTVSFAGATVTRSASGRVR